MNKIVVEKDTFKNCAISIENEQCRHDCYPWKCCRDVEDVIIYESIHKCPALNSKLGQRFKAF